MQNNKFHHQRELECRHAFERAVGYESDANYPKIIKEFKAKGIPESEIQPRVNVFTAKAWLAQSRKIKQGQEGVRITIKVPMKLKAVNKESGKTETLIKNEFRTATVFHISQTEPLQTAETAQANQIKP